ncbi:hypothetical protein NDU88_004914 [Pleurodeles waltl]|uniref:Integrase p58-like C-terminal domain-containing protein n=1 Tax=Pleurodeles waltl TaxID=8319 RepID=A0AAV7PDV1_PLEWA|nr:hypothetical protein NDU88_004914 [Pleurodeles waltl]
MAEYMKKASKNLQASQELQKQWHDQKAVLIQYQPGQKVWVLGPVAPRALQDKWSGPHLIVEKKGEVTYLVDLGTARSPLRVLHVNRLKPYYDRADLTLLMATERGLRPRVATRWLHPSPDSGVADPAARVKKPLEVGAGCQRSVVGRRGRGGELCDWTTSQGAVRGGVEAHVRWAHGANSDRSSACKGTQVVGAVNGEAWRPRDQRDWAEVGPPWRHHCEELICWAVGPNRRVFWRRWQDLKVVRRELEEVGERVTPLEEHENTRGEEVKQLHQEILWLQDQQIELQAHAEDLENWLRKNNIRIRGAPTGSEEEDIL